MVPQSQVREPKFVLPGSKPGVLNLLARISGDRENTGVCTGIVSFFGLDGLLFDFMFGGVYDFRYAPA